MKLHVDDKGQPILPQYDSFTERLAQAERAHAVTQELLDENVELRMQAERERDDLQKRIAWHNSQWEKALAERDAAKADYREMRQAWDDATSERDAALARLSDGVSPHDYRDLKAERDEWKAKFEARVAKNFDRVPTAVDKLRAELELVKDNWAADIRQRDAALASVDAWQNTCESVGRDLRNALAKAEAAQEENEAGWAARDVWEKATLNLRARIEALADVEEKDGYTGRAFDLRALLQPPKAETARERLIASMLRNGAITEQQRDLLLEQPPPHVPSSPACDRKS